MRKFMFFTEFFGFETSKKTSFDKDSGDDLIQMIQIQKYHTN